MKTQLSLLVNAASASSKDSIVGTFFRQQSSADAIGGVRPGE
jgi:hypothetical protein